MQIRKPLVGCRISSSSILVASYRCRIGLKPFLIGFDQSQIRLDQFQNWVWPIPLETRSERLRTEVAIFIIYIDGRIRNPQPQMGCCISSSSIHVASHRCRIEFDQFLNCVWPIPKLAKDWWDFASHRRLFLSHLIVAELSLTNSWTVQTCISSFVAELR